MVDERSEEGEIDISESLPAEHPELKPGIKLPKSDSEWANLQGRTGYGRHERLQY